MRTRSLQLRIVLLATVVILSGSTGIAADDLGRNASWQIPSVADARDAIQKWFATQRPSPEQQQRFDVLWPDEEVAVVGDLLDNVAATIALVDPRAQELVKLAQGGITLSNRPDVDWLGESDVDPLVRNNLRLYVARALVQEQFFDEALVLVGEFKAEDVFDPAARMFYAGVIHHRLLQKEDGLKALARLLERPDDIPERFRTLAELMQGDLQQLKDDSLDHISRRMDDIQRRLDLGRANKRVRDVEDGVIESLDKLIKEMEDKQQQQMAAGNGQGSNKSMNPAEMSTPMEGKGKGEVDKKRRGRSADWGALPAKEREEAMQEIGRDFPAHYREVIEEYFKALAKKKRKSDP